MHLGILSVVPATSVVLVIVVVKHVRCEIHTTEGLVGQGSPSQVNHHGAISVRNRVLNVIDIVRKLDSVSEDEHPGLAEVSHFRLNRVV
jgi:hypothetical protein